MPNDLFKLDVMKASADILKDKYSVSPDVAKSGAEYNSVDKLELVEVTNIDVLAIYIAEKNGLQAKYKYEKSKMVSLEISKKGVAEKLEYYARKISLFDKKQSISVQHMLVRANKLCRDFQVVLGIEPKEIKENNFKHEPGDGFKNIDDAALAWSFTYSSSIIKDYVDERLSGFYKDKNIKFTQVAIGNDDGKGNNASDRKDIPDKKDDSQYLGFIHSHPARREKGKKFYTEVYSPNDLTLAISFRRYPLYLLTAAGVLQKLTVGYRDTTHYKLATGLPGDRSFSEKFIEIHDYKEELGKEIPEYKSSKIYILFY